MIDPISFLLGIGCGIVIGMAILVLIILYEDPLDKNPFQLASEVEDA